MGSLGSSGAPSAPIQPRPPFLISLPPAEAMLALFSECTYLGGEVGGA